MSEQMSTANSGVRLDPVVAHGKPVLDGAALIVRRGLVSSETLVLPLDALRSLYLFFPKQFKWRVVQSSEIFSYVDLDSLSEQEVAELQGMPGQYRFLLGSFHFVLTDPAGHAVKLSWKSLLDAGIDPIVEFGRYRAARQEKRALWLQQNKGTTVGASGASFRGAISINTAGIWGTNGKFIPWYALGNVKLMEQRSLVDVCYFQFIPVQGSGLKGLSTGISPRYVEIMLAELHFWSSRAPKLAPGSPAAAPVPAAPLVENSGLAVASLVTGILGWTLLPFIGALAAIVTGHLALRSIAARQGQVGGKGQAATGLVLGYAQVGLIVLIMIISFVSSAH